MQIIILALFALLLRSQSDPKPVLKSITPNVITNGIPYSLTVRGSGFTKSSQLYCSCPLCTVIPNTIFLSSTELRVYGVARGVSSGVKDVMIRDKSAFGHVDSNLLTLIVRP